MRDAAGLRISLWNLSFSRPPRRNAQRCLDSSRPVEGVGPAPAASACAVPSVSDRRAQLPALGSPLAVAEPTPLVATRSSARSLLGGCGPRPAAWAGDQQEAAVAEVSAAWKGLVGLGCWLGPLPAAAESGPYHRGSADGGEVGGLLEETLTPTEPLTVLSRFGGALTSAPPSPSPPGPPCTLVSHLPPLLTPFLSPRILWRPFRRAHPLPWPLSAACSFLRAAGICFLPRGFLSFGPCGGQWRPVQDLALPCQRWPVVSRPWACSWKSEAFGVLLLAAETGISIQFWS